MDAERFESFLRSLSASPSRRSAMRVLAGLVLGRHLALGSESANAHNALKKCKKIEDKAKRKKCVKKAKAHNATHATPCTPNCSGKACGDDGCGGSCGSCPGNETCQDGKCICIPTCAGKSCGTNGCGGFCGMCSGGRNCIGGTCTCPSGTESCGGTCVAVCGAGLMRRPDTCACCIVNGSDCSSDTYTQCCSESCPVSNDEVCVGRPNGDPCTFDAQCQSGDCFVGTCTGQIGG